MLHGKFACLRNILINLDERVDGLQILRFLHLSHVVLAVFLDEFVGTETSRTPISHLIIIGVQLQIRLLAVCLESDEMQQIVVKGTAIHALLRQWNILSGSMLGKEFRLLQGFLEELAALLFVHIPLAQRRRSTLIQRNIITWVQGNLIHLYPVRTITIHLAQHSISHGLQRRVRHLQHLGFHPLHMGRQRVGRNLSPEYRLPHLSRQQLAIILGSRSLGDDFLHHRDFALRLVLLSIDFSLLPQVFVCLSRYLHRSKEGYQK